MGTRADFYVGRGEAAEWIGSITWDGYPDGIDEAVYLAETESEYREAVSAFFVSRTDVTYPTEPWPWPWDNSQTTDYAYAFDGDAVYATFGHYWFKVDPTVEGHGDPNEDSDGPKVSFPDMSARKGDHDHIMRKSGLITVSFPSDDA